MSERPCIIHIGTHKTGTTSLQVFFQENAPALAAAGVHVAQAGRFQLVSTTGAIGATPGNHELAWDLVADGNAKLAELVEELRVSRARSAIVSSEDFSLLYARPHMLETLAAGMRSIGWTPKIVVYLRAQAAYAESMYVERVKHNHVRPIDAYLATILEEGRYLPAGTRQDIAFDYTRLVEPFVRVFGRESVAVRAYAPKEPTDIFRDFLSLLAAFDPQVGAQQLKLAVSRLRENESLTFGQLLGTLHADLTPANGAYVPNVPADLVAGRFALLRREEYLSLLERFREGNEHIALEYDARIPFTREQDVPSADDPVWEKARQEREIFDRCLAEWSTAESN